MAGKVKLTEAMRGKRIRINAKSVWILCHIDEHVRYCNIRGPIERFRDIAADPLDSLAIRSELDDLIRRRLLTVVDYGFDDSMGRDLMRDSRPDLCGTSWSVNPTDRLSLGLWPDRIERPKPQKGASPAGRALLASKGDLK